MRAFFLLLSASLAAGQTTDHKLDVDSFERVWTLVRDRHWQPKPGGLDWQAMHTEFRPRAEKAATREDLRGLIREMLGRLKQTHFGILPGSIYDLLAQEGGPGETGMELRVLNGSAIVTRLDPGSPAEKAGVRLGWKVVSSNGGELDPLIAKAAADPSIHELQLTRSLAAKLTGMPGGKLSAVFEDGSGAQKSMEIPFGTERGELAQLGNMPASRVWFESQRLGQTGYVRFNLFLDLVRVMAGFQKSVEACKTCDGLILDLRGNPGGIGGMAMGMAGFLIDKPGQKLGTMYMRDATLNFVVNPRPEVFAGPVAVLVDALSASTSEILAGGLKDLGRARIYGTKTAAAALPSNFERLPNGDGFQFAVANYISEGGKPLEGLGVTPDQEVRLTREELLAGRDPVLNAALAWIRLQKGK
jgi:carboxyl-terminal processing protease